MGKNCLLAGFTSSLILLSVRHQFVISIAVWWWLLQLGMIYIFLFLFVCKSCARLIIHWNLRHSNCTILHRTSKSDDFAVICTARCIYKSYNVSCYGYLSVAKTTLCFDKSDHFEYSEIDLQKFVARFQYLVFRTPRAAFAFGSDPIQITTIRSSAVSMFIQCNVTILLIQRQNCVLQCAYHLRCRWNEDGFLPLRN